MSAPKTVRVTLQIEIDLERWASDHNLINESAARRHLKAASTSALQGWLNTTPVIARVMPL